MCQIDKHFSQVTDPRVNRGTNYDLVEMIFIALTATMCGAQGWADIERFAMVKFEWFERFIPLDKGVASHDTLGRVFARLDTADFLTAMHGWVDEFAGSQRGKRVAIDGQVVRGLYDIAAGQSPLHLMTAYATQTRLCLRQMSVDGKSNEIPAVPVLLQLLELSGATVTMDALHCQVETAQAILDREADYLLSTKDNQPTLHQYQQEKFARCNEEDAKLPGLVQHITRERSHGRQELRHYYTLPATTSDQNVLSRWPGLKSFTMVYRQRTTGEQESAEIADFIKQPRPESPRRRRTYSRTLVDRGQPASRPGRDL